MPDDTWWRDPSELKDEQKRVVELPLQGSYLILGPPGSGKTNLLLLRAAYLVRSNRPNVAVLMFTRSLRDFVVRGAPFYGVPESQVMTIMKWGQDLLLEQGVTVSDLPDGFQDRRAEIAARLWALLQQKPALRGHLECVIVDEVHDCMPEEIELFLAFGRDVFFAGDRRQRIYRGDDVIASVLTRVTVRELKHHYRNGIEICRVADAIGKTSGEEPILPTCNYNESRAPSDAKFYQPADDAEQADQIIARLEQQLKAYPGELLGVAAPLNVDVEALRDAVRASALGTALIEDTELASAGPEKCIYIGTLHDIKGLEFRALHLASMHTIAKLREVQKRVAFTSVTRAKTSLAIYHLKRLPAYLEQAKATVQPEQKTAALDDLFPLKH